MSKRFEKPVTTLFCGGMVAFGLVLVGPAAALSPIGTEATQAIPKSLPVRGVASTTSPFLLALGMDTRIDRRQDAVENTADRVDDKQDFREERRDCVGDGPDCRSDNRQDKRQDTVDRSADRVDDRRDRRWD